MKNDLWYFIFMFVWFHILFYFIFNFFAFVYCLIFALLTKRFHFVELPDPFAKISVDGSGQCHSTDTCKGTLDPKWNQHYDLYVLLFINHIIICVLYLLVYFRLDCTVLTWTRFSVKPWFKPLKISFYRR